MKRAVVRVAGLLALGAVVSWFVCVVVALAAAPPSPVTTIPDYEGLYLGESGEQSWWCQITNDQARTVVVLEPAPRIDLEREIEVNRRGVSVIRESDLDSALYRNWKGRLFKATLRSAGINFNKLIAGDPAALSRFQEWVKHGGLPKTEADRIAVDAFPSWAGGQEELSAAGQARCAFGWPARAFYYDAVLTWAQDGLSSLVRGGWELPEGARLIGPGPVVPYRILPLGLVIDTVASALIIWCLFVAPVTLRRWVRRRRRECLGCGYPIGRSDVCTECGRQVLGAPWLGASVRPAARSNRAGKAS